MKVSSILLQYLKNPKAGPNRRAKRADPFEFLLSIVSKHQKIEWGLFGDIFFEEKSHNAKKLEERTL